MVSVRREGEGEGEREREREREREMLCEIFLNSMKTSSIFTSLQRTETTVIKATLTQCTGSGYDGSVFDYLIYTTLKIYMTLYIINMTLYIYTPLYLSYA